MYIFFAILFISVVLIYRLLNISAFGSLPKDARMERIAQLPMYKDGAIRNLVHTPDIPEGVTYWDVMKAMIKGNPRKKPPGMLPFVQPELHSVAGTKVTWFGHSSYLLQIDELKILVDPVFSRSTSPFSMVGNKSYDGTDFIHAEDFDKIDILLITHDHYDHMDMHSVLKLKDKTGHMVTSLGVGAHLERWGVSPEKITELAWDEQADILGLRFTAAPARHFSGRKFKRGQTLWSSFILETPLYKLFLGGDSGYESHFKTIGDQYGPFDLAILECGQYNEYWPYIHMFPEQVVKAAKDLKAEWLLPVHWAKFSLALHDWDEPILRVLKSAEANQQKMTTPQLGETIVLGAYYPDSKWWLNVAPAKQ
ncbi:MBL fold metallo-hydrolase [Pedobacter hartonius]|uniref:L-ascorbate metabolism protein UlaG, beta-lactamase superfamily n=1 Tax=Pedobacter hartonius TaxID=425514 RepID=A0A1H4HE71_9SPHI|nr:MBL fold metallo-hydrolase [Pedobacter hartonius]SEB20127.1 L-ascorbate metabolism protein UlaG, beta-lactamase superfamily [Pedobacter hartonius]